MKIEIEISEETAALVWANSTWCGKYPRKLEEIIGGVIADAAAEYRQAFPDRVKSAVEAFRLSGNEK